MELQLFPEWVLYVISDFWVGLQTVDWYLVFFHKCEIAYMIQFHVMSLQVLAKNLDVSTYIKDARILKLCRANMGVVEREDKNRRQSFSNSMTGLRPTVRSIDMHKVLIGMLHEEQEPSWVGRPPAQLTFSISPVMPEYFARSTAHLVRSTFGSEMFLDSTWSYFGGFFSSL